MSRKKLFSQVYRYDIALEEGVGPWMVAWISGLMVFFVTLTLAVNFGLSALVQGWTAGLANTVTVELPAAAPGDIAAQKNATEAVQKILTLSKQHPAVASARQLENAEVRKLVEPWLGSRLPDDLPLPSLVDLVLVQGTDVAKLTNDIAALAPAATVDTHSGVLNDIRTLANTARLFVLMLTGVITALAVVSIAGIVRAKFSIHEKEVETLHLLGAADEYIAKQFRLHTLKGALKGAFAGLFCMILTLLAAGWVTHTMDAALVPRLKLLPLQWFVVVFSPVILGSLIAHLTAQRAVMKELAKLP